jgi:hypothetical protein
MEAGEPEARLAVGLAAGLEGRRTALAVTAVVLLAGAAAGSARALERTHTARTARTLEARLGVPVHLGSVEADLSGALHVREVKIGQIFAADEVTAAVGISTLLRGELAADELSLRAPRLRITAQADGTTDVAALVARARGPRQPGAGHASRRPRRILASDGQLRLVVVGVGEISTTGLELFPSADSLRVVTGPVVADLAVRGVQTRASFTKSAVDVDWTTLRPRRAALAGGAATLSSPGGPALPFDALVITQGTSRPGAMIVDAHGPNGPLHLELERQADGALSFAVKTAALPLAALAPAAPPWLHPAGASVAADVHGRVLGHDLDLSGRLATLDLVVDHPLLAAQAVPLTGQLSGEVHLAPGHISGRFTLETGPLVVRGSATAISTAGGALSRLAVDLEVPQLACADALAAVPRALAGPLVGLDLDGTISGKLHAEVDTERPEATILDLAIVPRCKVLGDGPGADIASFAAGGSFVPVSTGVSRSLAPGAAGTVRLRDLPDFVPAAFIAGEDARFLMHDGFDLEQMRRSLAADLVAGKVERGGSTITQQLAKNLFLSRERTLGRKLVEAVLAWRLESLGKPRLLELYLAVIELGGGAIGLAEGARRWFGKSADELDVAEAAFLAALTPAPQSSARRIAAFGGLDPETAGRVQVILRSMRRNRLISDAQYQHARQEALAPRP